MQKVYYDATNNREIVDVTGQKPFDKLKQEFNLPDDVQSVEIGQDEAPEIKDGKLSKKSTLPTQEEIDQREKETKIKRKAEKLKRIEAIKELKKEGELPNDFKEE